MENNLLKLLRFWVSQGFAADEKPGGSGGPFMQPAGNQNISCQGRDRFTLNPVNPEECLPCRFFCREDN